MPGTVFDFSWKHSSVPGAKQILRKRFQKSIQRLCLCAFDSVVLVS